MPAFAMLELDDGEAILIETVDADIPLDDDEVLAGDAELDRSVVKLGDVGSLLARTLDKLRETLEAADFTEIELECGVSVSAEAGWFVAKAAGEASLKIRCRWAPGL